MTAEVAGASFAFGAGFLVANGVVTARFFCLEACAFGVKSVGDCTGVETFLLDLDMSGGGENEGNEVRKVGDGFGLADFRLSCEDEVDLLGCRRFGSRLPSFFGSMATEGLAVPESHEDMFRDLSAVQHGWRRIGDC